MITLLLMSLAFQPPEVGPPCTYTVHDGRVTAFGSGVPDGKPYRPNIWVDRSHGAPWYHVSVDGVGCYYVSPA